MKFMIAAAAAALIAGILPSGASAADTGKAGTAQTGTLTVRFENIEIPAGQVMVGLYDSETGYDAGTIVRGAAAPVQGGEAVAVFEGLPPGRYAVKAFHDVDGDGKMTTNPFGTPTEPFAFSNNAKPEGGPARWAAASFDVAAGAVETRISIK